MYEKIIHSIDILIGRINIPENSSSNDIYINIFSDFRDAYLTRDQLKKIIADFKEVDKCLEKLEKEGK